MARQMKDSGIEWIDSIPTHWQTIKLCYVTEAIFLGKTPVYFEGENENYTLGQRNNQQYGLDFTGIKYSTDEHFASCNEQEFLQYGDVLLNSLGTGSVGRIGYFDITNKRVLTDGHIIVIRANEHMNARYLFFYLRTLRTKFEDDAVGSTNQAFLTVPKIYKTPVPFPPLLEQQRIAAFLDRKCAEIDAVIEHTKATIEEYKKLKQAVITEAVTKGVRGPRPMKDSGIEWVGEIPEEWMLQKLKNVTRLITDGTHVTPNYIESGVPFLSIKDISSGRIDFGDAKYISAEEHQQLSKSTPIEKGDMLFTRMGTLGVFVFVDTDTVFDIFVSVGLIKFRSSISKANKHFIRYFLLSTCTLNYINLVKAGGGTAAAKFNLTDVRNTVFAVPPSAEQEEIVAYLDEKCAALDTLIAKKTALLTELETYKKSLIYEYVTGKKEVL